MKKIIFACFTLAVLSVALTGCKVSGEVDDDGNVAYPGGVAR